MSKKTVNEIEEYIQKYKYDDKFYSLENKGNLIECLVYKKRELGNIFSNFHNHDLFEILYVTKGKLICLVENYKYTLEEGEMVLISPSIIHKVQTIIEQPCERIIVTFTEQYAQRKSTEQTDLLKIFKTLEIAKYHKLSFNNAYKRKLENLLETMQNIIFTDNYGTDVIFNCCFCSLMVLLNRELVSNTPEIHSISFNNKLILEVGNYIEENLENQLFVEDIAKHVSLSASRLHHIFKYETGISILKYINKKRLSKAKELLKTGDLIVNIYIKCGFQDYTSFFRAFKKEYEITPKEYQKRYFQSLIYFNENK